MARGLDEGRAAVSTVELAQRAPERLPARLRHCRRLVAAAVSLPEFLRAAGGLAQRLDAAGVPIELLVATDAGGWAARAVGTALGALDTPALRGHRLALPDGFGADREPDLVAALSELIGFDPEPGLHCLVPVGEDERHQALRDAARRLAPVYRMRLVGYPVGSITAGRALALDDGEWRRKSAALAVRPGPAGTAVERRERFVAA